MLQVQSVVRAPSMGRQRVLRKKNPLTNLSTMLRLNPYAQTLRRMEHDAQVCRAPARLCFWPDRTVWSLRYVPQSSLSG